MQSRVTLEIDLAGLRENFRAIAEAVAPLGVIAVLKADAYGLGVQAVAGALARCGVAAFAVAELSEALAVRGLGPPVLILGTLLPEEVAPALEAGLRVPVAGVEEARAISAAAQRLGVCARCHIALDTGMGRVGLRLCGAAAAAAQIASLPGLAVEGAYSHFPCANNPADPVSEAQVAAFTAFADSMPARPAWLHIANSDGVNNIPSSRRAPFTHIRTGLNLYGLFDPDGARTLALRPVVAMRARLAQVRTLSAGDAVGYGRTFLCPRAMRVGTVAAGYADGLPLALSNCGALTIRGKRCPVVGRVSMDYTTVSLDGCGDARAGDDVLCFGSGGAALSDWAALKGTHPYELLCSIGRRVRRVYKA